MFGSTWGQQNNQQQQQQPQQQPGQQGTSAFGQPTTFGSGGAAFGSSTFGQNSQQPAQPVNPMFGGATTNTATPGTTGTTGFGGFGGGGTSAFGAKPAFGAFGGAGTATFGSGGTGAFGQNNSNNAGTGAFGQPTNTGSTFGGSGLFGTKPTTAPGVFGSATSTGGTAGNDNATGSVAPVTTGTVNPAYSVHSEKDTSGAQPVTLHYQSISMMPAYRGSSFEELRFQDYAQGRKTAGGFGQSAAFGLNPAPAAQASTSTFGQVAAGSTNAFGSFGQNNQASTQPTTNAFNAFAQPSTSQQPPAFGGGTTAFGGFQQNQQQHPSTGTGLFPAFGQNNQQQQQAQPAQPTTSAFGGGFGNTQNKPFGSFGATTTGTNAFSTPSFGQNNQQQQQQGQTNTTGVGLFGQPPNQQQGTTNAFGNFGQKPTFGQPATQPTSGFGLFNSGQQNQQQNQTQQQPSSSIFGSGGTGLFGQNNSQQQGQQPGQTQPSQPSIFGQPQQTNPPGILGNSMFGNNNNQPKPAFGSSFGLPNNSTTGNTATNQPQTNLFGSLLNQNTTQPPGTSAYGSSSVFGTKPPTAFGQTNTQAGTGLGGSLFGGSNLGGSTGGFTSSVTGPGLNQQGSLTASVAEPVQTNLPIFSLLKSGPQAAAVDPPPKKAASYFVDVPTRSPFGFSTSRAGGYNRLRGFGSPKAGSLLRNNGLSSTMTLTSTPPNALSLSRTDSRGLLGPEAFLSNSVLGSDGKPSPKKLVLDKKMDPSEVFGRSSAGRAGSPKVAFNPAMSVAAREKEGFGYPSVPRVSPSAAASPTTASPGKKATPLAGDSSSSTKEKGADELQEGDYWVKPSLDVLRGMSNSELSSFEGLVVGRKGYGEVQFLEPVDLTALPRLSSLLGKIVQIDSKECCVYPDSVEGDDLKPPPGEGINVKARIVLLGCWPMDKATREPVKDENHPSFVKHLKRLKNMKHTHFENYSIADGKWTFVVDHF